MLGSTFLVEAVSESVIAQVREAWQRLLAPTTASPLQVLHVGSGVETLPLAVHQRLTYTLNTLGMAQLAGHEVMLHAGAVSDGDGTCLVFVGESGGGKTTAVVEFARHGWGYVTDETVAVSGGSVRLFPKPLSLVLHPSAPELKTLVSPDVLGLGEAPSPLSLGHIVLLNRDSTAHTPDLSPLSPVHAAWRMFGHTSYILDLAFPLQSLADMAATAPGCWSFHYRDIWASKDLLAQAPAAPTRWFSEITLGDPERPLRAGEFGPAQVRDAIVDEQAGLLLIDDTPLLIDLVTAIVFEAAQSGATVEHLVATCQDHLGEHPEAGAMVDQSLSFLVEHQALQAG